MRNPQFNSYTLIPELIISINIVVLGHVCKKCCVFRLFDRGSHHFNVVLGDANLNIDLPFGVQNHEISEVIIHENYRPEDKYHHEDIGKLKLKPFKNQILIYNMIHMFSIYHNIQILRSD